MIKSLLVTSALLLSVGASYAQDARVAPGVVAPNSPRLESNGTVSPPPANTVTGGVGGNEQTGGTPGQTLTGGPSAGKGNGGGGS